MPSPCKSASTPAHGVSRGSKTSSRPRSRCTLSRWPVGLTHTLCHALSHRQGAYVFTLGRSLAAAPRAHACPSSVLVVLRRTCARPRSRPLSALCRAFIGKARSCLCAVGAPCGSASSVCSALSLCGSGASSTCSPSVDSSCGAVLHPHPASPSAQGSNAPGFAVVAFSATLANSTLAVSLVEAGTAFTAENTPSLVPPVLSKRVG